MIRPTHTLTEEAPALPHIALRQTIGAHILSTHAGPQFMLTAPDAYKWRAFDHACSSVCLFCLFNPSLACLYRLISFFPIGTRL